ncbi:MAG: GldG family protein, partial [Desulfobacterales bacterium]|nr:GldG family protein [Desulfobacterales bacterium]
MKKERYLKGFMYTAVLILLYMAGSRLFFRQDLTASRIYSLSEASIETVKSLSEPLTINIFFSKDLPAPHNGTEKYLSDLLQEYAIHGGRHFNYRFYPIGGDRQNDPESRRNADLASSYGIRPMNIQVLESDEVKFKTAYMGLVIIHGDLMERLPAITTIENLEYDLTMAMMKLSNKISTLLALDGKIEADFYLSNSLAKVAPYMGLKDVGTLATRVEETLSRISRKNYDRIFYKRFAPLTDDEKRALSGVKGMVQLKWPPLKGKDGLQITSGSAVIGMVLRYGKHSTSIPILKVSKNPLFGNQYTLMSMDQLEEAVSGAIESLIDINEKVGYLTSNGAPPRFDRSGNPLSPPTSSLNNFSTNLAQSYSVKEVDLAKDEIPENLNSLIIAGPTEAFSDHQLFQIDQALMSGKNVAIFVDAFKEIPNPNKQMAFMQPTIFTPVETNLKKLLNHYGIRVKPAYIMDEKCYKQALPRRFGGGQQTLYYIPIIENEKINHELPFLRQIKGLVTLKAAPVTLDEKRIQSQNLKAETLFSTSDRSWTQSRNITLNTMTIRPPADESAFSSQPVAVMVQGEFTSYFAD